MTVTKVKETSEQKSARVTKFWEDKRAAKQTEKFVPVGEEKVLYDKLREIGEIPQKEYHQREIVTDSSKAHIETLAEGPYLLSEPEILQKEAIIEYRDKVDYWGNKQEGDDILKNITDTELPIKEPQTNNHMQEDLLQDIQVQEIKVSRPILERVKGRVAIKPYVSQEENMGLENPNQIGGALSICPGLYQLDRIGCGEVNGIKTYVTGLNELDSEVQLLPKDKKLAKIREIRETVAFLENSINSNYEINRDNCMDGYGTRDDKFWSLVTMFKSSGPDKFDQTGKNRIPTYWDKVEVKLDNDGLNLNLSKPEDLVIFHAIEARGLSMIAPSLQIAMDEPGYKFYLDTPFETAGIKTGSMKLRNRAGGHLDTMLTHDQSKLFLMCKVLTPTGSTQYKRGGVSYTPPDQMYEDLNNYLDGKTADYDKATTISKFLSFYDMPIDELTRRAVVKDATELRLIEPKGDGRLYFIKGNAALGKNIEEIVEYLKNPLNEDTWLALRDIVETKWVD